MGPPEGPTGAATPSMNHPSVKGLLDAYNESVRPDTVLATVTPESAKVLSSFSAILGKEHGEEGARAFVCYDGVCHLPTSDVSEFKKQLLQKP